jgi:FKBP-type peptidyl-prolyl cis-trans isomerase
MKRMLVCCVVAAVVTAGPARAADPELKSDDDKTLYALGLVIAGQLSAFRLSPAELEVIKSGISDGTLKKPPKVELETYGPKIKPLADARAAVGLAEEKKKGKEFLDKLAAKPTVKKTASGLMYEVVSEGTGKNPGATDKVKVSYKGTLIDGKVFDSSEKHGGSVQFALNEVVKCWSEGIQLLKVGSKAKLYCPSDLAYGDRPNGDIPAGATLLFDVELQEIVK